jgi:uncharacterized protein YkwD
MLLFHYVLCIARRAFILYVCVLLSTLAINEQSKREAKKGRRTRERAFLHANATKKVGLACTFWEQEKKRERERERETQRDRETINKKIDESTNKKRSERVCVCVTV